VTEFAQNGVEHDAAERVVFHAEQAQRWRRTRRHIAIGAGRGRRGALRRRHRDGKRKRGASAVPLRDDDVAPHGPRQLLDRRQAEPGAAEARCNGDVGLRERAEQAFDLGEREADPAVGDRKCDSHPAPGAPKRRHPQRDAAMVGELHRVVDQVLQRRAQANGIADREPGKFFRYVDRRFQALCRRAAGQRITGIARQRAQVEKILPHLESGPAASRGVDKQRRKARQMFGARLDGVDPAPFALIEVGGREQIADRQDAGERRADLMREGRQRGLDHAGNCGGGFALAARLHSGAGYALFRLPLFCRPCDAP